MAGERWPTSAHDRSSTSGSPETKCCARRPRRKCEISHQRGEEDAEVTAAEERKIPHDGHRQTNEGSRQEKDPESSARPNRARFVPLPKIGPCERPVVVDDERDERGEQASRTRSKGEVSVLGHCGSFCESVERAERRHSPRKVIGAPGRRSVGWRYHLIPERIHVHSPEVLHRRHVLETGGRCLHMYRARQ
jgi:hypothetical protein